MNNATQVQAHAQTLINRGCSDYLAQAAAEALANVDGHRIRSRAEQALVDRAWAAIRPSAQPQP